VSDAEAAGGYFGQLGADLLGIAREAVSSGGVRVYVKTNLGPEVRVSGSDGRGLADALGIRAAVVVRDRDGRKIAGYGEYPATDPLRAGALWGAVALAVYLLLRGVLKR
jgi:hypothetical protein